MRAFIRDLQVVFSDVRPGQRFSIAGVGSLVGCLELVGLGLMIPLLEGLGDPSTELRIPLLGTLTTINLVVLILLTFSLRIGVGGLYQWWVLGVLHAAEATLTGRILQHYFGQPFDQQLRVGANQILRTVRVSASRSVHWVGAGLVNLASEVPAALAVAAVIGFTAPRVATVVALFFMLTAWTFQRLFGRRTKSLGERYEASHGAEYRLLTNMTLRTREIIVRNAVPNFLGLVMSNRNVAAAAARRISMVKEGTRLYLDGLFVVGLAIAVLVSEGRSEASGAAASIGLLAIGAVRALPIVTRIVSSLNNIRSATGALRDTADFLTPSAAVDQSPVRTRDTAQGADPIAGNIVVADVTYRYPGANRPAVQNASLTVASGSSTALVGRSGAGKSTLVDLMLGLLAPTSGTIHVGDRHLADDALSRWRSQVSIVPQEIAVLDGSVAENVVFGHSVWDAEAIRHALEQAQLSEDIQQLPDGEHTVIGEGGVRLSGGQIQRIGLARALYVRPQVLFLDEATSALDSETELAIRKCIETLAGDITRVVVAHRLSTVMMCDSIIHVSQGTVCHSGAYEYMYERCTEFRRLVQIARLLDGQLDLSDSRSELESLVLPEAHERDDS